MIGPTIASSEQEAASTLGLTLESVSRCLLSLTQAFGRFHVPSFAMTARDLFQLAVQLLGLAFLYHGIIAFPTYLGVLYTAFGAHSLFAILQATVAAGLPLIAGY
jgi:hypothetical protein